MLDGLVFLIIASFLLAVVDLKLSGEVARLKESRRKIYKEINNTKRDLYRLKREVFYEQGNKIYGTDNSRFNKRETRVRK